MQKGIENNRAETGGYKKGLTPPKKTQTKRPMNQSITGKKEKHPEMMFGIFVVVGVQTQHKEERLASVFNVFISLPRSHSPPPPPSSVRISVGGVSSDLCLLMLTAANLLRPTTKASW